MLSAFKSHSSELAAGRGELPGGRRGSATKRRAPPHTQFIMAHQSTKWGYFQNVIAFFSNYKAVCVL